MKIVGHGAKLAWPGLIAAIPGLKWNLKGDAESGYGFLSTTSHPSADLAPWVAVKDGAPYYVPCAHLTVALARAVIVLGELGTIVYVEKHGLQSGALLSKTYAVVKKYAAKGLTCKCPLSGSAMPGKYASKLGNYLADTVTQGGVVNLAEWVGTQDLPLPTSASPAPPTATGWTPPIVAHVAKPAPAPGTGTAIIDAPILDAPPLTGEVSGSEAVVGAVDLFPAVTGVYVRETLRVALEDRVAPLLDNPVGLILSHLGEDAPLGARVADLAAHGWLPPRLASLASALFNDTWTSRVARWVFDYLALAVVGETRHAGSWLSWKGAGAKPNERKTAYVRAMQHDPRQYLPVLVRVFSEGFWGSGYGGPKWAVIARAAVRYFDMPPLAWLDHAVDLSHNGGLAFDKGYLAAVSSKTAYLKMLDMKRHGDLLQTATSAPLPCDPETLGLLAVAVQEGVIPWPACGLMPVPVEPPKPIAWGSAPLHLRWTGPHHAPKFPEPAPTSAPSNPVPVTAVPHGVGGGKLAAPRATPQPSPDGGNA